MIQLSEIVIQISGVLLHRIGACDSGLRKNDPVSRMIQLSVSQSSEVYCIVFSLFFEREEVAKEAYLITINFAILWINSNDLNKQILL